MSISNTAHLKSSISSQSGEKVEVQNSSNVHIANVETDVVVTKSTQKDYALPKDKITVLTTITNNANSNIENITILDTLHANATFCEGTVKIGLVEHADLNPITGFDFPATIGAFGGEFTMSYQIEVVEYPESDELTTSTNVKFKLDEKDFSLDSNVLTINILNNDVALLKTADSLIVKSGDTLTYTIEISNNGKFENTELFFTDPIPTGTTFVENSVYVGEEKKDGYNPETGFNLPDLNPTEKIVVKFSVLVD